MRAGTWAASTGVTTITLDDLRAMLAAASDPEVDEPAVRIGHLDPRFDGEPALGWVRNLRVDEERGALVGDLEDVPAELAALIPTAFRRRSVEIGWNVRTPAGKRYRAALTGLALLGVTPPAVKGLADVIARYSTAEPARVRPAALSAGDEVFVVDAEGGEDTAGSVAQALATARAALAALPAVTDVLDLDPSQEVPNVPITDERLRELLGVEADADLEATITTLRTRAETNPSDPGNGGNGNGEPADPNAPGSPGEPAPGTPGSPDGGGAEGEGGSGGSPTPPTSAVPDGAVLVSAAALSALQADAAAGAEARRLIRAQEVETELRSALSAGRIAPADVEHWRAELTSNFDGARSLLSKLSAVFPTSELGSDAGDESSTDAAFDSFLADVFGVSK